MRTFVSALALTVAAAPPAGCFSDAPMPEHRMTQGLRLNQEAGATATTPSPPTCPA